MKGEVWVRQSDGRAVLVTDMHEPQPHFEPDTVWGGGRSLATDRDLERIRKGWVGIRPVEACPGPTCAEDNPKWHGHGCPPGFHRVRGRHSNVRLDRFADDFSRLRGAA